MTEAVTTEPAAEAQPEARPATVDDLASMAHDYHVPMARSTLEKMAPDGTVHPQHVLAYEEYLKKVATGLYPTLAPQIQSGLPTSFLLDPYRQVGKQVLGDGYEPDFQTNLHDRAALQGGTDPSGHPAPMTLDQWSTHLKSDPAYGYMASPDGQNEKALAKQRIISALKGAQ